MQTILIVDDTKTNINILIELLDEYDVITSLNGLDAIELLDNEDVDLILLDIMMPQMDGFEVCEVIKSNPKTKNIPIIFLTAKNEKEDIDKGFSLGAVDYLIKPFYPSELKARVKTHLELRLYQKNLEKRVEEEVSKNRLKDEMLFQKSKEAEIGELMMQISHQWKQPLMEIGSINMLNTAMIKLNQEINKDELLESFDKVSSVLKFMSNTMKSFQNFYKPEYKKEVFSIKDAIDNALSIVGMTLKKYGIEIEIDEMEILNVFGNFNEYSNVILTILNNAKDISKYRKIKNPKIKIKIFKDDKPKVSLHDNLGGVKFENINDIFLPFISQRNSAGFGLYMAKTICNKNGGDISVENKDNGALFTIVL